MSSTSFPDGQVAATIVQANDMTTKETFAHINLETFMGLLREKLRECLVKVELTNLKPYCCDNNLKILQACKEQVLIEITLNCRDMGFIKSAGDPTASTAIPDQARTSSSREGIQHKLSGHPSYEQVTTGWN